MAKFQILVPLDVAGLKQISIGRDPTNDIVLPDPAVSGLHAVIENRQGRLYISDCQSRNGVFVNRKKIKDETLLHRGDIIAVGDSILIPQDISTPEPAHTSARENTPLKTKNLNDSASKNDWETLWLLLQHLQRDAGHLDDLLKNILQNAANMIPCDAGYIELDSASGMKKLFLANGSFGAEATAIAAHEAWLEQVRKSGKAVIYNDADSGSALCAPFHDHLGRVNGLLLLQCGHPHDQYTDKELALLQQLAGFAGLILQNVTLVQELETEKKRNDKNVLLLEKQGGLAQFFIGRTKSMSLLKNKIDRLAAVQSNVLITGETGVGKGMVARLIHQLSSRAKKPFVSQNCAGIPEDLIESALFGHMKGAFTHAVADQEGLFELAHGGTLFLDEIGDLSLKSQAKILSVIEDRVVRRLGGKKDIAVDIRLICASHKNLAEMAESGSFRQDLLYRLQVAVLDIPALRQRKQDIPHLVECFLDQFGKEMPAAPKNVTPEAMALLQDYDWPGNLRQLRNVIESAIIWGDGKAIIAADLPDAVKGALQPMPTWEGMEKEYLARVLLMCKHNISKAGRMMAMDRTTVYEKIKKYGLER